MRNWKKRFLALALSAVMTMGLLPGTAYAAVGELVGNSPRQNEALLDALTELAGPEDAREFYDLLQEYGLLDKNGEPVTDRTIDLDGERYTLKEVEALLDDPDTDLSRVAEVDGVPITLGDLATVIAIEREIQYLQKHYFSGRTFEDEALDNVNSLLTQLQTQGLTLSATPRAVAEQVVLGTTGTKKVRSTDGFDYSAAYISSGNSSIPLVAGDTFQVKFKLAIPDAIQALDNSSRGSIVVGFATGSFSDPNQLTAVGSETATITTTVEDALTSPNQEYTLEYEVTKTLNNGLYLYVSYQNQLSHAHDPDIEIGDLPQYAEYSFGDLYGAVSFYEPEGFLFEDSTGKTENYNLFFSQTVTMPTLVSEWTQASGEETEYQPANMTGVVGFDLIDTNAAIAEGDFFSLDKTIAYLEACKGETLNDDQRQRFCITATLRHSNTENVPLTSSIEIFNHANEMVEIYNFTTDLNYGTGFPINNLASSDTTNPKTTIISFNAFNAKPGSTSSTILTHLPTTFYAYYYDDPNATEYNETRVNNNVVNAIGYVSNASISLVNDSTKPTLTISAPAGEYKSGDLIPINIHADEYIDASGAKITINGTEYDLNDLHASSSGKFISLLYEVKEIDSRTLTVQSVTGITDFFNNNAEEVDGEAIDDVTLDTPLLKNAVDEFEVKYEDGTLNFTITAKHDADDKYQTLYSQFTNDPDNIMRLIINGDTDNPHTVTMGEETATTFSFTADPYAIAPTSTEQIVTVQLQVNDGGRWVTVNRVTQTVTIAAQVDVERVAISVVGDVSQGEDGTYTIALDDETFPQLQAEFTTDNTTSKTGT